MKCEIGDVVEAQEFVKGHFGTVGMEVGDQGEVIARYFPKGRKTPSSVDVKVFGRRTVRAVPCTSLKLVKEDI